MSSTKIQERTQVVKQLVGKVKSSALRAWEAGQELNKLFVEDFHEDSKGFKEYLRKEIGLTLSTAKKYIKLFKTIKKEDLSEHMLVTQLYPILDLPPLQDSKKVAITVLEAIRKKPGLTANNVNYLINFAKLTEDMTKFEDEVNKIIHKVEKHKNQQESIQRPDQKGKKIESDHFPDLLEFFPNQPIDEQGLVGLFCSMFSFLRDQEFQMHKDTIKFDRIQYIRTRFPDAQIEAENPKKQSLMQLHVEFEYQSKNFFTHKHNEVRNKQCNLIICWEDNLDSNRKNIPLVLSIQKVLQTGKIELINHNKN